MPRVSVIGSGFSGLSAACYAARAGHEVTVFEKNSEIGGRARSFSENGFAFDMGPSWYWMPDVFEKFFADFGQSPSDYYDLVKLSPSFQIFFNEGAPLVVPSELTDLYTLFESIEKGSALQLKKFLAEGELKYKVAMQSLIYQPCNSWTEFASVEVISAALKTGIFRSMGAYTRDFFKDARLIALMEFPVIFLGAMPDKIPALYSLMNYSAYTMGTWYPMRGMYQIIKGMETLALSLGVKFQTNAAVEKIVVLDKKVIGISLNQKLHHTDVVIASADYRHVEQDLLDVASRNFKTAYWDKKTMAPSALIFFIGVNKKIKNLLHHNLFFDTDFNKHASQIYNSPQWPDEPLFYVSCPSKTDNSVAPGGMENLFILIPLAAGLKDEPAMHESYFLKVMSRLEKLCNDSIAAHVVYKKSYCLDDFQTDYNAYKGNAYGLANTLGQTAVFKPGIRNKRVDNLFYAGQLTVPGPGVPPALISGKIAANEAIKHLTKYW
ncbi:MAG: phytoene desaturase family protein [Bacteroidota bacterium]